GAVLALAMFSDALALWVGAVPVILVAALRLAQRRRPPAPEAASLLAALAAVPVAVIGLWVVSRMGGFATVPISASFVQVSDLPRNLGLTVEGGLMLFGADFFGRPLADLRTLNVLVHLAGFA